MLKENLDQLYYQVNDGYNLGLNPHLRFDKINKPIIETPAVEKPNLSKISSYFTSARFISILDLLADVEKPPHFYIIWDTKVKPMKGNDQPLKHFLPPSLHWAVTLELKR